MATGPTGAAYRGLQIHPTRQCNLRCLHCYSSSAPEERGHLSGALLRGAITAARDEGYTLVSFSGGEPVLYKPLRQLLDHAHRCGMVTTVTSNGMLLDERRLELLCGAADVLAISLDGIPSSHNRMRGSPRAFETMCARLDGVRRSGIPFGFIFTLTQHNLNELEWVANFAFAQGAKLLQIHPLEVIGRAGETLPAARPDQMESAYAYLEVARIRKAIGDKIYIQLDLVDREFLRTHPDRAFACESSSDEPLAELVSPLIIEDDGWVVPIGFGFSRRYALGDLHHHPLGELAGRWRQKRYAAFRRLCRSLFEEETTAPHELPFVNWYELLTLKAEANSSVRGV